MSKTIQFNSVPIDIQAAATEKGTPKFSMVAYTGGLMRVAAFDLPVVVDFAGLEIERQNTPIRLDHDRNKGVGHTTEIVVNGNKLVAKGFISRDTESARDVANSGKQGFPWQASIGAAVDEYRYVPSTETIAVNGQNIQGECYHVTKSKLNEISFTESGADVHTEAIIASKDHSSKGTQTMPEKTLEAKQKELKAENDRLEKIAEICGDNTDVRIKASKENWSVERTEGYIEAQKEKELADLQASRPTSPGIFIASRLDDLTSIQNTQIAGVLMAMGEDGVAEKVYGARACEHAQHMRLNAMETICANILQAENRPVPNKRSNLIEAAASTMSLPTLLGDSFAVLVGYKYNQLKPTWASFARKRNLPDYRNYKVAGAVFETDLKPIADNGDVQHGVITEKNFADLQVDSFAKVLSIGHKSFVNDRLNAFSDIAPEMARGALRTLSNLVYKVIKSNGGSFFSTANKNYAEGADTALGITSLSTAVKMMREQLDPNDGPVDIVPAVLVVPPALEAQARTLLASVELNQTEENTGTANPWKNLDLSLEVEPRLGAALGGSDLAWYLFAGPNDSAVNVAFLDGVETPRVIYFSPDTKADQMNHAWRVTHNFGSNLGNPQAAVKMKGQA